MQLFNTTTNPILSLTDYRRAVDAARYHNHCYFVLSAPEITDAEFDELYFAIRAYETAHPDNVLPDSPTQHVGDDTAAGKHTIAHRTPMLSTQKVKTVSDIKHWMQLTSVRAADTIGCSIADIDYTIEWKYDGVSCSLVYLNGKLIEASTRGNCEKGQDILNHVQQMNSIPKTIKATGRVEIRGEVLMPFDHLEQIPEGTYGDTRTAASAILNSDNTTPYDSLLVFFPWEMTDHSGIGIPGGGDITHSVAPSLFWFLGFNTTITNIVVNADNVEQVVENMTRRRVKLSFPTDGLVIKLNRTDIWESMGRTDHHPKYLLAYKFPPATAETVCTGIDYTTGEKTGKITPIALFEPVTINGKQFSKASLGSNRIKDELGIAVGSRILVSLRNDVIPHVERVL